MESFLELMLQLLVYLPRRWGFISSGVLAVVGSALLFGSGAEGSIISGAVVACLGLFLLLIGVYFDDGVRNPSSRKANALPDNWKAPTADEIREIMRKGR